MGKRVETKLAEGDFAAINHPMAAGGWIVGLDIGGTFTDVFMLDSETRRTARFKSLSTPDDPARGAIDALHGAMSEGGVRPGDIDVVLHATTLVSNALIERNGARTALVTTEGFRDLLEIAREKKYDIYDIFLEKPAPLVPRDRCYEVRERMAADGGAVEPVDPDSLARVIERIADEKIEAVAVCLLHSYLNADHERSVGAAIRERLPDIAVSLSSELLPEMREYERATSTTANAFVQPAIDGYLERLASGIREAGIPASLYVMLSSGGISTTDVVRKFPLRICESGPAAGAVTAARIGGLAGADDILSFDMGGTTAKACLIHGGTPVVTTEFEVARMYRFKKGSGLPIRVPVVDLIEIGAGGGSIAGIDELDLLKVGPHSAGSDPGPACYGRGGELPTVTDADLVLGYLGADSFLGGRMTLDPGLARRAIERHVARPLGLGVEEAALGIHAVVNENMANAARIHTVERGHDPARHVMVAFGGAGPVHAYGVARRLGIGRIVVPPSAGIGSALGLHLAPRSFHLSRTHIGTLGALDWPSVDQAYGEMTREAVEVLKGAGVRCRDIVFTRVADMRYAGQRKELAVMLPPGKLTRRKAASVRDAFERDYERVYRRTHGDHEVEALTWRLVASGPPIGDVGDIGAATGSGARALTGRRPMTFDGWRSPRPCPVYQRSRLAPGRRVRGPAAIEDADSTIVIEPGGTAVVDPHGNVVIDLAVRKG
jgi:N-methylhydantoinase A